MKLRQVSLAAAAIATVISLSAGTAQANFLNNPGFETGDFSSWTLSEDPASDFSGITTSPVNSGNFALFSGAVNQFTISQQISDTPGTTLTISGFLDSDGSAPDADLGPIDFQILLNNVVVLDVTDFAATTYTVESATGLATGSDTIAFAFNDGPGFLFFDDASVTAASTTVPEPASMLMLGAGLAGLGVIRRRQRVR